MRLLIFGKPASGKGTQAKRIADHLGIPHLSTGDMLRDEIRRGTKQGQYIKSLLDKGQFISDEDAIALIKTRIAQADCANGFILDGFPRTVPQVHALNTLLAEMGLDIDKAFYLDVSDDTAKARMGIRATAENRTDDTDAAFLNRLAIFSEKTAPVLDHYPIIRVDAQKDIDTVFTTVLTHLS